jgi:NADH:ubiquinone oxidoreductase subunit 4 (subunit M)
LAATFDDFLFSLMGALLGLVVSLPVTYLVVDRIVERNSKRQLEPVTVMAKERLSSKLGVDSLTTMLITLVIDVRSTLNEGKPIPKDVSELTISKLKSFQSDLEVLLGIYNNVLPVKMAHLTGSIISQIEHLLTDPGCPR